jgi:hypothetical protein
MIKPWQKTGSKAAGNFRIFTIRQDFKVSPRTGEPHDFYVLDSRDWVNVIAVTPDRQLVMIEQYRQGTDTVELEIPGGIIDPKDASPAPPASGNCARKPATKAPARDCLDAFIQIPQSSVMSLIQC